jgi:hypothetical protein
VCDGLVHGQIGQGGLLTGDDHVDVLATAQAMIGNGQQRVCRWGVGFIGGDGVGHPNLVGGFEHRVEPV